MKNDPMLDAIQEILAKAKSYSDEPLMNKLKSKMVIAVEKPKEEEEVEAKDPEEVLASDSDPEDGEDKEKLKSALAKLFS